MFMVLLILFSLYTIFSATCRWGVAQMKSEADQEGDMIPVSHVLDAWETEGVPEVAITHQGQRLESGSAE